MTRYRTSLARAGWALALGGACVGIAAALLAWRGGSETPGGLATAWAAGAVLGALAIAGVGGPVWWLVRGSGPVAAGLTGAGVCGLATLAVLTQGFGAGLPLSDAATLAMVWSSATATALIAAFLGGLLGLAMWLVSYRPG